ncbi:MAG: alpha/beta fold hydrolase [Candidatus Acidiferrales bacterium]
MPPVLFGSIVTQAYVRNSKPHSGFVRIRVLRVLLAIAAAALVLTVWRAPIWFGSRMMQAQLYSAGIHSYWMILDGHQVHYLEGGTGDPVVLVHGLGASAQNNWRNLMPRLVRSGHHLYAMDLLGYGESAMPADRTYSIDEEAKFVEAFLDAKGLHHLAVAGVSMGGWIAATVALDQPQRITRLILLDSAGLRFAPDFDLGLFTPQNREQVDGLMAILTPHPQRMPGFVKDDLVREISRHDWVIKRSLASMLTGADLLDERFPSLKMPLLVVWGKEDVLTPLSVGQSMHAAAPQSVFEVYDGCGHLAVETCADRISPRISSFLAGTGPPTGATVEVPADGDK